MNILKKKKFESFFKDYILTLESKLKDIQLDKLFTASELILKTIGFSNFSGGFLDKNSDISIHSKVSNYGVGEDINHILMHLLMQFIAKTNLNIINKKNKKLIL